MSEFTPITTQEAFDNAIKERLERERSASAKKYEGYASPEEIEKLKTDYSSTIAKLNATAEENAKKYADFDNQIKSRDEKIKAYETDSVKTRIALENGIPYEMVSRVQGTTVEEITADCKALSNFIGNSKQVAPLANHEPKEEDAKSSAIRKLAKGLKGE